MAGPLPKAQRAFALASASPCEPGPSFGRERHAANASVTWNTNGVADRAPRRAHSRRVTAGMRRVASTSGGNRTGSVASTGQSGRQHDLNFCPEPQGHGWFGNAVARDSRRITAFGSSSSAGLLRSAACSRVCTLFWLTYVSETSGNVIDWIVFRGSPHFSFVPTAWAIRHTLGRTG